MSMLNTHNIFNSHNKKIPDVHNTVDLAFSSSTYLPESLLNSWLNVSGVILTSSLLFYHMSRVHSLKVNPFLAKIVAIGLIIVSTAYMLYAFIPYSKRMNYTISKCTKLKECSQEQVDELLFLKNSYLALGIGTSAIQFIIVYLIISTI